MKLAVLANPGHNRAYFNNSAQLALAELTLATGVEWRIGEFGGIPYFICESDIKPTPPLFNLSSAYAIFELLDGGLLKPISPFYEPWLDPKICTLLKYTGKTNELFTKLTVNIAALTHGAGERLTLFDPVAGKGTALFEGLTRGMDVYGMEIVEATFHDGSVFLKKFLESEKIKHSGHSERVSGTDFRARVDSFTIHGVKGGKRTDSPVKAVMACCNSRYADLVFGKSKFDLLVGDLPYGVAHGNVASGAQSGLTRNPKQLLEACLPAWRAVMKKNGVAALSWNINVLPRAVIVKLLETNGFEVMTGGVYERLEHRVDQAITRDIVVAKR